MNKAISQRVSMTKERLKTSIDNFITDKLTDCFNHIFLNEYLINEMDLSNFNKDNPSNLSLIYIKIDNIMDINIKYSNQIGNETISNLSYLLKEISSQDEIVFKETGPNFITLCHDFQNDPVEYVRNIQNRVKKADIFIEPITVSCAIVSIYEIDKTLSSEEKANLLTEKGIKRINLSRELGNNSFIDKDTTVERNFFGNVLIADSDSLTVSIMKSFFEEQLFEVETAASGAEALTLSKEKKYDVIIADRYIKKINGLTLKKHINESSMNMNTMYILTVQSKNLDIINKANLISINHVFDKPIILQELLGIIKRETEKQECMRL